MGCQRTRVKWYRLVKCVGSIDRPAPPRLKGQQMIEKFTKEEIESVWAAPVAGNVQSIYGKINELVDAVTELHEEAKDNARIRANYEKLIDTLVEENNIHEKQIDELQTKVNKMGQNLNFIQPEVKENVQDPYNEQRWVGCLCKLWTGDGLVRYGILRGVALNRKKTNYPYQALSTSFEHCEPVKPDDDIIYKGGDNE